MTGSLEETAGKGVGTKHKIVSMVREETYRIKGWIRTIAKRLRLVGVDILNSQ